MRGIGDGLHKLFVTLAGYFVQQQRQQDGQREAQRQVVQADGQRVYQQALKIIGLKKAVEVRHAHPLAAHNALADGIAAEGDLHAVHGRIVENDKVR